MHLLEEHGRLMEVYVTLKNSTNKIENWRGISRNK